MKSLKQKFKVFLVCGLVALAVGSQASAHNFSVGEIVGVDATTKDGSRVDRVDGTIVALTEDGYATVRTPENYNDYSGSVMRVYFLKDRAGRLVRNSNVGVDVLKLDGAGPFRAIGMVSRIYSDDIVVVRTEDGFKDFTGDCRFVYNMLDTYNGHSRFETVTVLARYINESLGSAYVQGTIQQIFSDGIFYVKTPEGFHDYTGPL